MMERPSLRNLRRGAALLSVAVVLGSSVAGTARAVETSAASSSGQATSPRHLGLSSAACHWLRRHSDKLPIICVPPPDGNIGEMADDPGSATRSAGPAGAAPLVPAAAPSRLSPAVRFGTNVDATDPSEDTVSGQSETAVAASGSYVLSAWNDLSGLSFDPGTPQGSVTGVAFSSDGGATFHDLAGPPNDDPCQSWFGDPSVVAYRSPAGVTYFYVTSLYLPTGLSSCGARGYFAIATSVGTVAAGGSGITFGSPVVVANGGNYVDQYLGNAAVSFLDKPFAAVDGTDGRIAVSYTCFGIAPYRNPACSSVGDIDLAVCDLGASPGSPACNPGAGGSAFMVVRTNPAPNAMEVSGSYPAFSARGDLYLAWSENFITNLPFVLTYSDPFVHQMAAWLPAACLGNPATPCAAPAAVPVGSPVKSLDTTLIPGYSRGIGNDFPRVAFDDLTGQLAIVWNEANAQPMGDIVMVRANRDLSAFTPKVRVNDDRGYALHLLPAVSVDSAGDINVSWYDRRNAGGTTRTDVYAASIRPGDDGAVNSRVTDVGTDWRATGGFITPNFGDYTDNASVGTRLVVNWSDGRPGVPNSYVASAPTR